MAIAGHRTTYLHPFYNLNELVPGDDVDIVTVQGLFVYQVTNSQAVAPTDVAVVAPTPTPTLTLTTCNPRYSASQRLVVQAKLVKDVLSGATGPTTHSSTTTHGSTTAADDVTIHGSWLWAIVWGVVVALLAAGVWALALRSRGGRRLAVAVGGAVAWLVVVYLFFGALAPLLPASY